MAQDETTSTSDDELAAARALVAQADARLRADEAAAAVKRDEDRAEGLAELRTVLGSRSYETVRDKIMAAAEKFHGDAILGLYTQFAALEDFARKAR